MFGSLAVYLYLTYRVTLATFLALPCYDVVNGKAVGAPHACSVARGSFNRAMMNADDCGGTVESDDRDGPPYYYAVCGRAWRESAACLAASVAQGGSPDLDCEVWEN